jgi:cytochrome c-type biogenesis protein CcmH/NrfG
MVFGNGITGLLVAAVVTLTSGAAFMICFRELAKEMFSRRSFDKTLRRNRNVLFDEKNGAFMIDDSIFEQLIQNRTEQISNSETSWQSRSTYLFSLSFLGLVAMAGFIAGISQFA